MLRFMEGLLASGVRCGDGRSFGLFDPNRKPKLNDSPQTLESRDSGVSGESRDSQWR